MLTSNERARLRTIIERHYTEKQDAKPPIVWHADKSHSDQCLDEIQAMLCEMFATGSDCADDSCNCHLIGQTCESCNLAYQKESEVQND